MNSWTSATPAADRAMRVRDYLKQLCVPYESILHDPIFTSNSTVPAFDGVDVLDIKNLFLKGHKGKRHYLVAMPYDKPLDLHRLADFLNERTLSFASEERLKKYLDCESGAVSIFGLLNDAEHEVVAVIDSELTQAPRVGFHPNISTETLIISQGDFRRFLESLQNEIRFLQK